MCFGTIRDLEVKLKKILGLTDLTTSKLFSSHEVFEDLVIGENLNEKILYYREQLESLFFKTVDDDKHFLVINDVIPFCRSQANGEVRYGLQSIVFVQL